MKLFSAAIITISLLIPSLLYADGIGALFNKSDYKIIDGKTCVPYRAVYNEAKQNNPVQISNFAFPLLAVIGGAGVMGGGINPDQHGWGKMTFLTLFSAIFTFRQLEIGVMTPKLAPYEVSFIPDASCPLSSQQSDRGLSEPDSNWNISSHPDTCLVIDCESYKPVITPLLTAGAVGGVNFGLNMLLELGFTHKSTTGLTVPGVASIGFKSIALTSGVESQLTLAAKNHFQNQHGLDDAKAQALAAFSSFAAYSGIVSLGAYLGVMEMGSATGESLSKIITGYGADKLPEALSVTAAYSLQSSVENTCIATFNSMYPNTQISDDEKKRLCQFSTSTVFALLANAGLLKFTEPSFKKVFLENYVEASSLTITDALVSYGRTFSDDPLYSDLFGLSFGAGYTLSMVGIDMLLKGTAFTTNAVHGAGLIMILEGTRSVLTHAYALRPEFMGGRERKDTEEGTFYCSSE